MFNYKFDHCLIKLAPNINTQNNNYQNTIINKSAEFKDAYANNFHLTENSPAINTAKTTEHLTDIEGNNRSNPDMGAYEFIE